MKVPLEQQLLTLTQEMLESAQASDWDRLIELEKTRQPLFQQIFEDNIAEHEALARQVLELDLATMQLAKDALPIMEQQLIKMRNIGAVNNAYQSIQNSTLVNDV